MTRPLRTATREAVKVARAVSPTHEHLRNRLAALLLASFVLDAVASVLILFAERNEPGTEITNVGDAVFWTSAQLLTVSSQMVNPLSTWGRVIDIALEFWAISVVAVVAGSFGAFFHRRGLEKDPIRPAPPG